VNDAEAVRWLEYQFEEDTKLVRRYLKGECVSDWPPPEHSRLNELASSHHGALFAHMFSLKTETDLNDSGEEIVVDAGKAWRPRDPDAGPAVSIGRAALPLPVDPAHCFVPENL
jgi:hypothetical protein